MRARIRPGGVVQGVTRVPGDKSIAHRWLMFAATAEGESTLRGLPAGEDILRTARCMAALTGSKTLASWAHEAALAQDEGQSPTWNEEQPWNYNHEVRVQAEGRWGLKQAAGALDCGNSGTTMRLIMGLLAGAGFESSLMGDASLGSRPMERVAEPLRQMGARIETTDGHAPVRVTGAPLQGIDYASPIPSAQVKSAVLLAGAQASGRTSFTEPAATRDHTERLLRALGAPVQLDRGTIGVEAFQHGGFEGTAPGDPSSAVYLLAAAALTGGSLTVEGVGLNPTRTGFLGVLERMGMTIDIEHGDDQMGEPVGTMRVSPAADLRGTTVTAEELPSVIDEVPILAAIAAHAEGETRFEGAAELRVKESDRLAGTATGLQHLGGGARVEGDVLIIEGGGLHGAPSRAADALGDHRLAMAFAVAALAADDDRDVEGVEAAAVTFPAFHLALAALGADLEAS